jgi:hypothetical protein
MLSFALEASSLGLPMFLISICMLTLGDCSYWQLEWLANTSVKIIWKLKIDPNLLLMNF